MFEAFKKRGSALMYLDMSIAIKITDGNGDCGTISLLE
jgi:hypothetical protein